VNVVAHLRCVKNPDQSPKFHFRGAVIISGKRIAYFDRHPDLWHTVDEYEASIRELKDYYRGKTSSLPSLRQSG
jgi:hypothetical protein